MDRPYQMCTRCLMDTTDPDIVFDENGVCNHCKSHELAIKRRVLPQDKRDDALKKLVEEIKASGKGKQYDCIIGVSGGVDSTYVAYLVKKLELNPLAVHMDNGWNSELAVSNIEKVLNDMDIDLYTEVLDWEEFKELQIAFLKASVSDAEIPTDHAIWAVLFEQAIKNKVKYIILGTNVVTEGIMPSSWTYGTQDWLYIKDVNTKFGKAPIKTFPHFSLFKKIYYELMKGIKIISILDYVDYNKQNVRKVLEEELGWRYYGGKHYESIYTRFFQGYILPNKFNIDKRKAHLSSLIVSGQVTMQDALKELEAPAYAGYMLEEDMEYVCKKFEFSQETFQQIMSLPVKSYADYKSYQPIRNVAKKLKLGKILTKLNLLSSTRSQS